MPRRQERYYKGFVAGAFSGVAKLTGTAVSCLALLSLKHAFGGY